MRRSRARRSKGGAGRPKRAAGDPLDAAHASRHAVSADTVDAPGAELGDTAIDEERAAELAAEGDEPATEEATRDEVREAALAMLSRRNQPVAGLRDKLETKFRGNPHIEDVLARFEELGLVNDAGYAEMFVRDRFHRAGYGRQRIRRDLKLKGVKSDDIEAALDAIVDTEGEREIAARALEKFLARRGHLEDRKKREAAFRHLVGRGFGLGIVRDLLDVSL